MTRQPRGSASPGRNTGAGLKYPETVTADPPVLRPGDALPRG